jgi:heme a synthase
MAAAWVHRLAVMTVAATVFLLFVGAVVTSKGAGLAVPDWPTTFGHNMFLFPWARMVGGVFFEHSHRLVASGVGLLTILLTVLLWMNEPRRWVRWLGTFALMLVIAQGVIGGLRVVLVEQWFAVVHAGLAQAFFGLTVALALFTSDRWRLPESVTVVGATKVQRLCATLTTLIYFQAVLGALIRHTGIAIELHVLVALLVLVHVFLAARRVLQIDDSAAPLRRAVIWLSGVLALQLMLGVGSYLTRFSPFAFEWRSGAMVALTTSHVVTGALMLALSVILTLLSFRLLQPSEGTVASVVLARRASA